MSKTVKLWILKKSNGWVLSTAIKRTYFTRGWITRILHGIECFVVKYWYWVKSEEDYRSALDSACAHMFTFFLGSISEIAKWTLRLGVQRVSGGHIPSCGMCVFGWLWCAPSPTVPHCGLYLTNEVILHYFWVRCMIVPPQTCICHNLKCDPQAHVELPTLKPTFRFQILMLGRNQPCERTQNSRRVGMLASDFARCRYLTTKDSMPCNILVVSALAGCV